MLEQGEVGGSEKGDEEKGLLRVMQFCEVNDLLQRGRENDEEVYIEWLAQGLGRKRG